MALILPDGHALVRCEYRTAGSAGPAIQVWGAQLVSANVDLLVLDWYNAISQLVMPELAVSTFITRVSAVARSGATYSAGETATAETQGGINALSAPPNCAYLVRKLTAAAGRAGRGRAYFPGVAETTTDSGGYLDSATQLSLQTAMNDFIDALENTPVLFHRDPLVPNDYDNAAPTPVHSLVVDNKVATQRRRMR